MERILKDMDSERGKDFFFSLRGREGGQGRKGRGRGEDVSLPRTIQVVGRYLSLRRGQQSMGPRSRLLLKPVCFAGSHLGASQTQDVNPPAGRKEARLVFSYVKSVCSIISPWKAD